MLQQLLRKVGIKLSYGFRSILNELVEYLFFSSYFLFYLKYYDVNYRYSCKQYRILN